MSNPGFRSPTASGLPAVKTGECPCVADLIDYAQGRIGPDERGRIESHLRSGNCRHCQGWIAKAGTPGEKATDPSPPAAAALARSPGGDRSDWRQQAFRDLEERLRQLEGEA